MQHLTNEYSSCNTEKVLANWATVSTFIYDDKVNVSDIKALLRTEVLNKNRPMIVERLTIRLLSMLKQQLKDEIAKEIKSLCGRKKKPAKTIGDT